MAALIIAKTMHMVPFHADGRPKLLCTGIWSRIRVFLNNRLELDKVMGTVMIHFNRSNSILNFSGT